MPVPSRQRSSGRRVCRLPEGGSACGKPTRRLTTATHSGRRRATASQEPTPPSSDSAAVQLREEIDHHRVRLELALDHAERALDDDELNRTISELAKVQRWQPANDKLKQLTRRVVDRLLPSLRTALIEGRLDQANRTLLRLEPLSGAQTDELAACDPYLERQINAGVALAR